MFKPQVREVKVTRTEVVIPNGATRRQVYDALWEADNMRSFGDAQKLHDDAWHIEAKDGEDTVIYWTTEEKT